MSINDSLKTSKKGLEHIIKWEGLVLKSYICPAGKPTIGVGHVILPGENYQEITKEQALKILAKDVQRFENAIKKHITTPLNQNQFDALVSFIFNTGEGGIINTGLQRAINSRNFDSVPKKLEEWSRFRVGGVLRINKGLLNRRKSEGQLFMDPMTIPKLELTTQEAVYEWTPDILKETQNYLKKLGLYTLAVDGICGPATIRALTTFAKNNNVSLGNNPKKEILNSTFKKLKLLGS